MENAGPALMGIGRGFGKTRARDAALAVITLTLTLALTLVPTRTLTLTCSFPKSQIPNPNGQLAILYISQAVSSPLLDFPIEKAKGVVFTITGD